MIEGQPLQLVKFVGYGWSATRSRPALRDQVEGALLVAAQTGWEGLAEEQRAYLDDFWARADVELEGDDEIQQAARFGMFHVLQAGARAEGRPIPAKGLSGNGYDGHSFWDAETFVLPVLTYTIPDAVAHALRWRHSTLPAARDRARQLGLRGRGLPVAHHQRRGVLGLLAGRHRRVPRQRGHRATRWPATPTPPATTVRRARPGWTCWCTPPGCGARSATTTARAFRIDGVTGPDEYSALADNNIYTNLMAQQNLRGRGRRGAAAPGPGPANCRSRRGDGGLAGRGRPDRAAVRRKARRALPGRGVHRAPGLGLRRHRAGSVSAAGCTSPTSTCTASRWSSRPTWCWPCSCAPDAFTAEQKARNFAYYEALTVRDSSLSACSQAVIAAETGHLDLAYDYLAETALMDLDDLEHNTRDGLHIAALAGSWIALVQGFGGMRYRPGQPPASRRGCPRR